MSERTLRHQAIGRENWMFVGSDEGGERTAIILTIVASAHRQELDVWAYLRDVLERLARGEDNLAELLPDAWKTKHPQKRKHKPPGPPEVKVAEAWKKELAKRLEDDP